VRQQHQQLLLFLAMLALLSSIRDAQAWGDDGHKIICEIAFRLAKPHTQDKIQKLIALDSVYKNFSDSCVFADHPRQRSEEHYINLPRDSKGLTLDKCPEANACVLTAILSDSRVLSSKTETDANRLVALKFLGHWVGDIHQPLHVSFLDDRGGNDINVSGQCSGNLHATWDTCLVLYGVGPDVSEAVADLLETLTPDLKAKWVASGPRDWANESFAISEAVKTGYCEMHGLSCDPSGQIGTIGTEYLDANAPVVREQLQKAGVRLAHLLDIAFAE
jgi:S1/P1 Nuclease